jgi:hypothetical protein
MVLGALILMLSTRNIDELPNTVPGDDIRYLKGLVGLTTHAEIQTWHDFCRNSPHESVRSMLLHVLVIRSILFIDIPWYVDWQLAKGCPPLAIPFTE